MKPRKAYTVLMKRSYILLLLGTIILGLASQCKKDNDHVGDNVDKAIPAEGQRLVSGHIALPGGLEPTTLKVVSITGSYGVQADGSYETLVNGYEKQGLFVENQRGDILLSAIPALGDGAINAHSTAKSIIAFMPLFAHTDIEALKLVTSELEKTSAFAALVEAIQQSFEGGMVPMQNTGVHEALQSLLAGEASRGQQISKVATTVPIPEVNHQVMPKMRFDSGVLTIENSEHTTAAWGVEVWDSQGEGVTGNLILPGNAVRFPSLGSVWAAINGNMEDAVFTRGEPLEIPFSVDGQYRIKFVSPSSKDVNYSLTIEAIYYNIATSIDMIFKAFGLKDVHVTMAKLFEPGCANELMATTTQTIHNVMAREQLTSRFLLDQAGNLIAGSAKAMVECADLFNDFPGSNKTKFQKYLTSLSQFINVYSKLEASFVLGRLLGDMYMLDDFDLCRQLAGGKMVPCFTIQRPVDFLDISMVAGGSIDLSVFLSANHPEAKASFNPAGVRILWQVAKGTGTLTADYSEAGENGFASMTFTAGPEDKQEVWAYVTGGGGEILQGVVFHIDGKEKNRAAGWYKGTYTLGKDGGEPAPPLWMVSPYDECGDQHGQQGQLYIYVGDDLALPGQIIVYCPSILPNIPNLYLKANYTTRHHDNPIYSGSRSFWFSWSEDLGKDPNNPAWDLYKSLWFSSLEFLPNKVVAGGHGTAAISIPQGTGSEECLGQYAFRYWLENFNFNYLGSASPSDLEPGLLQKMEQLRKDIDAWFYID